MRLEYATNPVWADAEQTRIDLTIKWEGIAEEFPFTASPTDTAEHGRAIFAAALAGEFGPVAAYVPPPPAPPPGVPSRITRRQGRLALLDADMLDAVEALMADPATPRAVRITYEDATEWWRSDPMIASFAASLALTDEQVDDLFRLAATL
jgi:hypothetical protein